MGFSSERARELRLRDSPWGGRCSIIILLVAAAFGRLRAMRDHRSVLIEWAHDDEGLAADG